MMCHVSRSLSALGLAIGLSCLVPADAKAVTITLDFETAATGSTIVTTPLVTAAGTITASASGASSLQVFTDPPNTGLSGNFLFHGESSDGDYGQLAFDFNASSISFLYAGRISGVFTVQALDASFAVVDSFFDSNTSPDLPGGPITLTGAGIRYLRFGDFPGGGTQAVIDNVTIVSVPEPATLALLALSVAGLGLGRRRRIELPVSAGA